MVLWFLGWGGIWVLELRLRVQREGFGLQACRLLSQGPGPCPDSGGPIDLDLLMVFFNGGPFLYNDS